jgi:hypothetical protein
MTDARPRAPARHAALTHSHTLIVRSRQSHAQAFASWRLFPLCLPPCGQPSGTFDLVLITRYNILFLPLLHDVLQSFRQRHCPPDLEEAQQQGKEGALGPLTPNPTPLKERLWGKTQKRESGSRWLPPSPPMSTLAATTPSF